MSAQASFADVPVVVLTGSQLPHDRRRCLEAGADEVLLKPMIYEAYLQMAERLRPYLPGRG
jgi:CheY-like chemotaxis protein